MNNERKIDNLMMSDMWTLKELLPYRQFSLEVIAIYIDILAKYHGLTTRQMRFLAHELTDAAIASFCDTWFRLKKSGLLEKCGNNSELNKMINEWFDSCAGAHIGISRKYRFWLANLIGACFNGKIFECDEVSEPEYLSLTECTKEKNFVDKHFMPKKRYLSRFFNKIKNHFTTSSCKEHEIVSRIGVFEPAHVSWLVNAGNSFDYVPIKINENEDAPKDNIAIRKRLYRDLLNEFRINMANCNWPTGLLDGLRENMTMVLFATILITAPDAVLDREKTRDKINMMKTAIKAANVKAVIARGNWGNGLFAAASIELGLPLIVMQLGGGYGIFEYADGHYEMQLNYNDHFLGSGWDRDMIGQTTQGPALLHKFTDPELSHYAKLGLRHDMKIARNRILLSPFVHSFLFRTELWHAYYPENALRMRKEMERFFVLLKNNDPAYSNYEVFVKLKAFSYNIFKGYEYLFGLMDFPERTNVSYLKNGVSQQYFPFVQLHLIDSISTGLMFSLVYNIPTVAFWDTKAQRLTQQASPIFNELRKWGVVVTNAEEMAEAAKKFMHYPEEWQKRELQEARGKYVMKFARSCPDWKKDIDKVMRNILVKEAN